MDTNRHDDGLNPSIPHAPAERLRAAAQVILDIAQAVAAESGLAAGVPLPRSLWFEAAEDYRSGGGATHVWVALLGPDKAQHLARWLRDEAERGDRHYGGYVNPSALAFADSILGGTT